MRVFNAAFMFLLVNAACVFDYSLDGDSVQLYLPPVWHKKKMLAVDQSCIMRPPVPSPLSRLLSVFTAMN